MDIRPLNDRILVKRIPPPETDKVAVVVPQCAEVPSTWGQVLAVGPGKRNKRGERVPLVVTVGDIVVFGPYTDFNVDDLAMIQEGDVRGVISHG